MRLWVIAYDIADDKRRRQLVKCLAKQTQRVQESIFEGWLTKTELNHILSEAALLLDLAEDKLRAYPLAVKKSERYGVYGQQVATRQEADYWIIG